MSFPSRFRLPIRALSFGFGLGAALLSAIAVRAEDSAPPASAVATEASLSKDQHAVDGWFQRLFTAPEGDARVQAAQQIETLGMAVDANSWIRAVRAKNRGLISLFLKSGFNIDARGDHGRTALLAAALDRNWDGVTELLKQGASPNVADDDGVTPLMPAAMAKPPVALPALLQAQADAKARDAKGHTALHYAVAALNEDSIRALIAAGTPVAGAAADGREVLADAFDTEQKGIITLLLQAQAPELTWTREARACLSNAIETKDAEMTRLLLSKFPAPPTPEGKAQPLLAYAVIENDLPKFKYLLDCGADPNSLVNSPVEKSFAAQVSSAFAKLYLENESGMTTLMLASGMDKLDFVKALLEKGAKRNVLTVKYKMPALFFAAHSEVAEIMQLLIGDCPTPEQMRIEISLSSQRLNLYKNGAAVVTAPCSTGRTGFATPAGRYVITDKHLTHTSTIYKTAQMPFFMRLNCRDFGMHEGQLPGYPASHGCIRLPGNIARQLYHDVPVGTLVCINR